MTTCFGLSPCSERFQGQFLTLLLLQLLQSFQLSQISLAQIEVFAQNPLAFLDCPEVEEMSKLKTKFFQRLSKRKVVNISKLKYLVVVLTTSLPSTMNFLVLVSV